MGSALASPCLRPRQRKAKNPFPHFGLVSFAWRREAGRVGRVRGREDHGAIVHWLTVRRPQRRRSRRRDFFPFLVPDHPRHLHRRRRDLHRLAHHGCAY